MDEGIEVLAIGSELLKGRIVNSNATEISRALMIAGFQTVRHTVVPDEAQLLKSGLIEALQRSSIIICTGGLGPTCDDLTRPIAAELFESDFYLDEELLNSLKKRYGKLVIQLENQATVPSKAIVLQNKLGTAPGLIFHNDVNTLILLPGVPKEMKALLQEQVIPYLTTHFSNFYHEHRMLYFSNVSESLIDPSLCELQKKYPNMEFGIYPSHGILSVELMLKGKTKESSITEDLSSAEKFLEKKFSEYLCLASNGKLEESVHQQFIDQKLTLSVAESCTGGELASRLTKIPGASQYFLGGVISYSNELKTSLLNVSKETLTKYGAVSRETVIEMVIGLLNVVDSDFGVAISGVAGPNGGTEKTPVGTVWIAIAKRGEEAKTFCLHAPGNREMVIDYSVNSVLAKLLHNTIRK